MVFWEHPYECTHFKDVHTCICQSSASSAPLASKCTRWDSESVPEECHTALEKLKTALTSPAVLSKPDPNLPFEVHVDASDTGIAGKLNQIEPSSDVQDESNIKPTPKERLIACVSRSLSKQERKWAAHEKEALAVIWSLEKFRTYLCAAEFTIYTDHRNLLRACAGTGAGLYSEGTKRAP